MVVGGGGREHAIIKKLRENKAIEEIFALPGNGGIAADAECVNVKATDIPGMVDFAKQNVLYIKLQVMIVLFLGGNLLC